MTELDPATIRRSLSAAANLEHLEVFARIDSTNTYLKDQPAPKPGHFRVAVADHQTAGRGRRERTWISEPGKSLCLSLSYRFFETPSDLSALTLALGVGVASCLAEFGVHDVRLKWPNDLLIGRDKLGGILTETRLRGTGNTTVIIGIGLNVSLPTGITSGTRSGWADTAVDLQSVLGDPPAREDLAGKVIDALFSSCRKFEANGFQAFVDEFRRFDALAGLEIATETPGGVLTGIARGVDASGELLLEVDGERKRIVTGSINRIGEAVAES